jgi:adenine C2-methylase RlmN of 23S rRNA A2503 and tRNA A37
MVNLIPWNPVPEISFRESPAKRVRWFEQWLEGAPGTQSSLTTREPPESASVPHDGKFR